MLQMNLQPARGAGLHGRHLVDFSWPGESGADELLKN
jgi:hypothetical protein